MITLLRRSDDRRARRVRRATTTAQTTHGSVARTSVVSGVSGLSTLADEFVTVIIMIVALGFMSAIVAGPAYGCTSCSGN
jgi:hypothetical protein